MVEDSNKKTPKNKNQVFDASVEDTQCRNTKLRSDTMLTRQPNPNHNLQKKLLTASLKQFLSQDVKKCHMAGKFK